MKSKYVNFWVIALCFLPNALIGSVLVSSPYKNIVFQPQFNWANHTCTQQGTGSFIKTSSGCIIGVTSAHFINFSGPKLLKVDWLDIRTKKTIATSVKSWGMPGHEGCYNPLDLRSDYILMIIEGNVHSQNILEIDLRNLVEIGERIWFPNKNPKEHRGYDLIEGTISEVKNTHLIVVLDQIIDLQSRSGTPIISQCTGKVIGILTGGGEKNGNTFLYLVPSLAIYRMLLEAQQFPLLQDVIGK